MKLMKETEEDIEKGSSTRQASEEVEVGAVMKVFQITDDREHRQGGFDQHALIPSAFGTQLEIGRQALSRAKAQVRQDDRAAFEWGDHRMKVLVGSVERCRRPIDHLPPVVEDPAQAHTNRPTAFVFRLAADLRFTATLTNRENQFNGLAVDDGEEARFGHEPLTPVLMDIQRPLQPGPIRQATKQSIVITLQPPVKGPKASAFERRQQSNRHQLTRPQFGLRMFGYV
jgi:hypothetical protein